MGVRRKITLTDEVNAMLEGISQRRGGASLTSLITEAVVNYFGSQQLPKPPAVATYAPPAAPVNNYDDANDDDDEDGIDADL